MAIDVADRCNLRRANVGLGVIPSASLSELLRSWLGQQGHIDFATSHGNVYAWLHAAGIDKGFAAVSLGILVALGAWTWRNRHADLWQLMAVAALTARMWAYYHHYDDVLILVAIVALWRWVSIEREADRVDLTGMLLIVLLWGFTVIPATFVGRPRTMGRSGEEREDADVAGHAGLPVDARAEPFVSSNSAVLRFEVQPGEECCSGVTARESGPPPARPSGVDSQACDIHQNS